MKTSSDDLLDRIRRQLMKAERVIDDLDRCCCHLFEFLEKVSVRLLLCGLLLYHAYAILHTLATR